MHYSKTLLLSGIIISLVLLMPAWAATDADNKVAISLPEDIKVVDKPNDAGKTIYCTWKKMPYESETVSYYVSIADKPDGVFTEVQRFPSNSSFNVDSGQPWWSWRESKNCHYVSIDGIEDPPDLIQRIIRESPKIKQNNKNINELLGENIGILKGWLNQQSNLEPSGFGKLLEDSIIRAEGIDELILGIEEIVGDWNGKIKNGYSASLKELLGNELGQTDSMAGELKKEHLKITVALNDIRISLNASQPNVAELIKLHLANIDFDKTAQDNNRFMGLFNPLVQKAENHGIPIKSEYYIKIGVTDGANFLESAPLEVIPHGNIFNTLKLNNFIFMIVFSIIILWYISHAKKRPLYLRRIAGLDAVDEALGRATEMGKPIYYLTGRLGMSSISTIAATVILGEIAKKVAAYRTPLKVPHTDPIVMTICQEITKEAYVQAGHPDAYQEDSNFYLTDDQFGYTAAVDGLMLREKPAACFFMGYYYAEALLLAETGASTGAIQIAGTDAEHQIPFFITACDYTLIGEELYAASAYLSREPVQVGTLRGQDWGKAVIMIFLLIGVVLVTLDVIGVVHLPEFTDIFKDF